MSRSASKSLSIGPVKFVPKSHSSDSELSEDAAEIKNRPLVCMVRKLTREDRLNIQGLIEFETRKIDDETLAIPINLGSVSKYIWKHCVLEVKNVLLDAEEHESLKGRLKDELFEAHGLEAEVMECVQFIQEISSLSGAEAKN